MTDIAELALKVDSIEAKQAKQDLDNMTASGDKLGKSVDSLHASYGKLVAILGTGGLALAFVSSIKHALELQEQYVRLSEVAGTTASAISGFDLPARLSSTSLDTVATSVARLGKSIGEARLGDVEKMGIFKALGININDGRDAAAVMVDVARMLTGMSDQTVAATASMALLNRGFTELRPLMKEVTEQGTLNAAVTNEQAAAAKAFQDQVVTLGFELQQAKFALANDMLPALNALIKAMVDGQKEGGLFTAVMHGVQTAFTGDDQFKTDKAIVELLNEKLVLENQILAVQNQSAAFRGISVSKLKAQLAEVDAQIQTTMAMRDELSGAAGKARGGGPKDGMDDKAIAAIIAEERIRQQALDKKLLEERIANIKGFGARYADAIKTANILADEAFKTGGVDNQRTQEALLLEKSANDQKMLKKISEGLEEQRALYAAQGQKGKAADAAQAAAQANQQIIDNETITQAKIQSLRTATYMKQMEEYNAINTLRETAGASLAEELRGEANLENLAYRERLTNLDMYLKSADGQIADAQQLRERLEIEHQAKLGDLFAQGALERMKFDAMTWDMQAKTVTGSITAITQSAASGNKKMFELNKIAALADIVVSTSQGVMKAWGQGGWFGYGMAALIAAAGAVNFHRVQQTQFGGGGGVAPSISGSAGGATPVLPVTPAPNAASAPPSSPPVTVIVQGHFIGTQEFMDNVILPAIRDAADNREFLLFDPVNSQQAQRMVPA